MLAYTSGVSPYTKNFAPYFTEILPQSIVLVPGEMLLYQFPQAQDDEGDYPLQMQVELS